MLQNAYFLAKIGADTAENEQHFAEILPKIGAERPGPEGDPGRSATVGGADYRPELGRRLQVGPRLRGHSRVNCAKLPRLGRK